MSTLREKITRIVDPYTTHVDDSTAIADALLPLIREAQAAALDDFSKRWHAWMIDDAPQIRGGAAYRAHAVAGEYREMVAAYRVGEGERDDG